MFALFVFGRDPQTEDIALEERERTHRVDPRSGDPEKDWIAGERRESSFAESNSPTKEDIESGEASLHTNCFPGVPNPRMTMQDEWQDTEMMQDPMLKEDYQLHLGDKSCLDEPDQNKKLQGYKRYGAEDQVPQKRRFSLRVAQEEDGQFKVKMQKNTEQKKDSKITKESEDFTNTGQRSDSNQQAAESESREQNRFMNQTKNRKQEEDQK